MIIKLSDEKVKRQFSRFYKVMVPGLILFVLMMHFTSKGSSILSTIIMTVIMAIICAIVIPISTKNAINKLHKEQEELYELASELSTQISAVRKVVCEGQAAYWMDANRPVSSGWMVLSEDALEYYELKKYAKTGNVAILLDDIVGTTVQENTAMYDVLIVNTKEKTYKFNVASSTIWKEQIDTTVAQ